MRSRLRASAWAALVLLACATTACAQPPQFPVVELEAERPARQEGTTGEDFKSAASGGQVLGKDWGSKTGHFAEYTFTLDASLETPFIGVRYARAVSGSGRLRVEVDGKPVGSVTYRDTGGWGDNPSDFELTVVRVGRLAAGSHTLRFVVVGSGQESAMTTPSPTLVKASPPESAGGRDDKNSVGHGKNVALYTGAPSRFFFATHELGNVFSAADGGTLNWYPDHATVSPDRTPASAPNVNLDQVMILSALPTLADVRVATELMASPVHQERDVCVTDGDVIVSRIRLTNTGSSATTVTIPVEGDCRRSFDWRGGPGGEKITRAGKDGTVMLVDKNVFPNVMPQGLFMVVGGSQKPASADTATPGVYRLTYQVTVPARGTATLTLACAVDRDQVTARKRLTATLKQRDPIAANRAAWEKFYQKDVPSFTSSDAKLNELYNFRQFLLQFSTAGGDLGLFRYPVIMEGRQAFQTYCCYSAAFMAFDRNWNTNPNVGWGHIASMVEGAYPDGRFPWYVSPRTNDVPLDHPSKTGQSLLPHTLWRWYQIHGDKAKIVSLYPGMAKNLRWWIRDRDPDGNGLFTIDHQLETGMDDLFRRWKQGTPKRYEAVDATVYTYLNLRAVANLAREVGKTDEAQYFAGYADKSRRALQTVLWKPDVERFLDRNPDNGEIADYNSICIFYPLMTDAVGPEHLGLIRRHLLNPQEYWTPHPLPALSQTDPDFDPVKGYWRGPSWPAATSHVIEGFASTAKRLDRSLMPQAAELFRRAAANHLQPRADFYERYNPFDGRGLSNFRDYMHSWWIDIYIRHVAGLNVGDDGSLTIDALPLDLSTYALRNVPVRGARVDVLFNDPKTGPGLTVLRNGKSVARKPDWTPGNAPLPVALPK